MLSEGPVEELLKELQTHLLANVEGLAQVTTQWPNANIKLNYPAISIFAGKPVFTNMMPYVLEQGDTPDVNNKILLKYVVGYYDFNLQLDLWCRNKKERNLMTESFFKGFNKQVNPMGLSLQLTNYHGIWARYDFNGLEFGDTEQAAQTAEWRTKISVLAHCKAVLDSEEYAMINIETEQQLFDTGGDGP